MDVFSVQENLWIIQTQIKSWCIDAVLPWQSPRLNFSICAMMSLKKFAEPWPFSLTTPASVDFGRHLHITSYQKLAGK